MQENRDFFEVPVAVNMVFRCHHGSFAYFKVILSGCLSDVGRVKNTILDSLYCM